MGPQECSSEVMAGARGFNAQASRLIEAICQPLCLGERTILDQAQGAKAAEFAGTILAACAFNGLRSFVMWAAVGVFF